MSRGGVGPVDPNPYAAIIVNGLFSPLDPAKLAADLEALPAEARAELERASRERAHASSELTLFERLALGLLANARDTADVYPWRFAGELVGEASAALRSALERLADRGEVRRIYVDSLPRYSLPIFGEEKP